MNLMHSQPLALRITPLAEFWKEGRGHLTSSGICFFMRQADRQTESRLLSRQALSRAALNASIVASGPVDASSRLAVRLWLSLRLRWIGIVHYWVSW